VKHWCGSRSRLTYALGEVDLCSRRGGLMVSARWT
jgi:hypothetical protein